MSHTFYERDPSDHKSAPALFSFPAQKRHIKRVIFNAPHTIVDWTDGSKTVVKCQICTTCRVDIEGDRWRNDDGRCRCLHPTEWAEAGVMNAMLKRSLPNYINELSKVFKADE